MKVVRYELRSASELDTLARTSLPLGIYAGVARGSSHRDLYLDTEDDALRSRGVVCRLRIGARAPHRLSLVLGGDENAERVEATVRATNAVEALAIDTAVRRRLLSIVDPSALVVRVVLEVDRLTRAANPDLLMRRRAEMHFDRITIRRDGETRTLFQLCAHQRRGSVSEFRRLVDALEQEHDLVGAEGDRRGLAELLLRWMRPAPESAAFQSSDHESPFVTDDGAVPEMLSPELSLLAFQRRVLALAEDPETPLRERLRFLGIVTSNLDEIYMVRMPELRQAAAKRTNGAHSRGMDGLTAGDRLDRVEREIASIVDAHPSLERPVAGGAGRASRPVPRRDLSRAHAARDDAQSGTSAPAPAAPRPLARRGVPAQRRQRSASGGAGASTGHRAHAPRARADACGDPDRGGASRQRRPPLPQRARRRRVSLPRDPSG